MNPDRLLRPHRFLLALAWSLLWSMQASGQQPERSKRDAEPVPAKVLESFSLGVTLLEQGRTEDALREFQVCLRKSPRYSAAAKMIGACHLKLGDRSGALVALRHALNLDAQNGELMLLLSSIYREDEQYSMAEAFLRGAEQRLGDTAEVAEEWLLLARSSGQTDQLKARLLEQIQEAPRNRRARNDLIELLQELKEFAAAADQARALAKAFPEDRNAPLRVAHLYLEGQMVREAASELESLASRFPDHLQVRHVLIDLYTTKLPNAERLEEHKARLAELRRTPRGRTKGN